MEGGLNPPWLPTRPSHVAQWERICLQCRKLGFSPWVRKGPWRRKWQPAPVFLPGKFHGQRSLVGYSPRDHKELAMTEGAHMHLHTHTHTHTHIFQDSLTDAAKEAGWSQAYHTFFFDTPGNQTSSKICPVLKGEGGQMDEHILNICIQAFI